MGNICVKFHLNLSSRFGEDLKKKFFKTRWRPNYVTNDVTIIFFDGEFMCRWQEILGFSHAALYLTNFHRHTASPMTSRKITPVPHRELSKMYQAKKISIARFQRYRGPKFIAFFKMAPAPCDQWRHNYELIVLSKKIHTMVKISCRSDLAFERKWFLKRKRPQIAGGIITRTATLQLLAVMTGYPDVRL